MQVGKIPAALLERLLSKVEIRDRRVILGPRVGEDAALIDYGDTVLVAKSDPITFATELIGWYAVQVNANDVACTGARPRWFLATLLLPEGATEGDAEAIFDQLHSACRSLEVSLVGGHSEVTQGLTRPIVVGCMMGEVEKGKIVHTGGARAGDSIVLTKGIAIEGTSILAREATDALTRAGVEQEVIQRARNFLFSPGISVVKDALAACSSVEVHSLHDPTEGGLATGLWKVARAAGVGILLERERVPVLAECQAFCGALGLDPLGLLASGALLVTLPPGEVPGLLAALRESGIEAWEIGRVTRAEEGLRMVTASGSHPLPWFERDELARFLSPS